MASHKNTMVMNRMMTRPGAGPVTVPDAHVADMRYLSEVERKTNAQIADKYSMYSRRYVFRVLAYELRAGVKPAPDDVVF